MCVLAIDTAGETASAAVTGRDGKIYEKKNHDSMDHLKSLMGLVETVLSEAGIGRNDIEHIAVSAGPGSFTGIRIGMAAARTMAQVLGTDLAAVMTLDAFTYNSWKYEESYLLCPMTDARRHSVYAAVYEMPERKKVITEDAYELADLLKKIPSGRKVIFTGSGAEAYRDELTCGELAESRQSAASVLRCALDRNEFADFDKAAPVYLRQAEAELKRKAGKLGLKARARRKKLRERAVEMPPADEKITYRKAGEADIDAMASLDAVCFKKAWGHDEFAGDMENTGPRESAYVAAHNIKGEMIAFAGAVYLDDDAEVNRVAVHPLYRRRGIAGRCMEMLLDRLGKAGVKRAVLEVRESNRSAITLYKNCGFRVISKRKNYYRSTGENALIMELTAADGHTEDTEAGTDERR